MIFFKLFMNFSCMLLLFSEHKAKIDATNSDGATALHDAITRGNMDIIEELVKAGASTTIRATNGLVFYNRQHFYWFSFSMCFLFTLQFCTNVT